MHKTYRVNELSESLLPLRVIDDCLPFVKVRSNKVVHLAFKIGTYAQLVVKDYSSKFLSILHR